MVMYVNSSKAPSRLTRAESQAQTRKALLDAADQGRISSERLADAAARVLELKRRAGLLRGH